MNDSHRIAVTEPGLQGTTNAVRKDGVRLCCAVFLHHDPPSAEEGAEELGTHTSSRIVLSRDLLGSKYEGDTRLR